MEEADRSGAALTGKIGEGMGEERKRPADEFSIRIARLDGDGTRKGDRGLAKRRGALKWRPNHRGGVQLFKNIICHESKQTCKMLINVPQRMASRAAYSRVHFPSSAYIQIYASILFLPP